MTYQYNPDHLFFGLPFRGIFSVSRNYEATRGHSYWEIFDEIEDFHEALFISQQIRYEEGCFTNGVPPNLELFK